MDFPKQIIPLLISIIVVATVLIPIIDTVSNPTAESSETVEQTYTNTGDFLASATADTDEHTMDVTVIYQYDVGATVISVNVDGVEEEYRFGANAYSVGDFPFYLAYNFENGYCVMASELGIIALNGDVGEQGMGIEIPSDEVTNTYTEKNYYFSIQNGIMSVDFDRYSEVVKSFDSEPIDIPIQYYLSSVGDYVRADENVSISEDSVFYTYFYWYIDSGEISPDYAVYDSIGASELTPTSTIPLQSTSAYILAGLDCTQTVESTIHFTEADGLIRLDSLDADITLNVAEQEFNGEPMPAMTFTGEHSTNTFIVPTQVTYTTTVESAEESGGVVSTILGIIPIFVLLGIFMGFVVPMVSNRFE